MDIARKMESHTVCICRHAFRTDFACKINFKSNFRESVDFQKNAFTSLFSKMQKMFHGLGQDISCIKFLEVIDFEALFKLYKRSGHILDR